MTNYNDGKWHGWNGGECPVHPETVVDVCLVNGYRVNSESASKWFWDAGHTCIIAFRVITEHKEPREFWATEFTIHGGPNHGMQTWAACESWTPGAVKFREVTE